MRASIVVCQLAIVLAGALVVSGCRWNSLFRTSELRNESSAGNAKPGRDSTQIFAAVKAPRLADVDPIGSSAITDSIDVNAGFGYYAAVVEPEDLIRHYQGLQGSLEDMDPTDYTDPEVAEMRRNILAKLKQNLSEIADSNSPVFTLYLPFFSVTRTPGIDTATNVSMGFYIFHANLGFTTTSIIPEQLNALPSEAKKGLLRRSLLWCRQGVCNLKDKFWGRRVVGLRAGMSVGHSLVGNGTVALDWARGRDLLGHLKPGQTQLELGGSAIAGLVRYDAYVKFEDGVPRLVVPAGISIDANVSQILQNTFHAIATSSLGVDIQPVSIGRRYYVGMKRDGTFGVVSAADALVGGAYAGSLTKDGEVLAMGVEGAGDIEMLALGNNPECPPK